MTFPQNIVVDLGNNFNVNQINLLPFNDRAYQFLIEGSTSSATDGFSTLTDATGNTSGGSTINRTFDTQSVRYVRLTITGASGYTGPWASIEDFEIICAGGGDTETVVDGGTITGGPFSFTVSDGITDNVSGISCLLYTSPSPRDS